MIEHGSPPVLCRTDGQQREGGEQDTDMHSGSYARGEIAREETSVEITREQGDLIEDQAGGPDGRRAAEPGKDDLGDERLEREEEEGAEEHGGAEEERA